MLYIDQYRVAVVPPTLLNAVHWWDFSNAAYRTEVSGSITSITDIINGAVMSAIGSIAKVTTVGGNGLIAGSANPTGAADERMTTTGMLLANLPIWVSWIGQLPNPTNNGVYFWNSGTGGSAHATGGAAAHYIAVSVALTATSLSNTTTTIFYAEFNGSSSKLYVNGSLDVSGNTGTASALSGDGALFNVFAGGNGGIIEIGEIVMGTGTNTGTAITDEYNRLTAKWI